MKQITSICLILLLSAQCFYKLGIIAYYNLNREYIAEVFCVNKEKPMSACHGQCFLKTNLELREESLPGNKNMPPARQQVEFPLFLISQLSYRFDAVSRVVTQDVDVVQDTAIGYSRLTFKPPMLFS